ncbi:MAG: hypothetical protein LBO05_01835 [Deltaproteobacteria bacterium]|jgi:hypothetical protein|nr:hypothetical protein [Deltaproteobacteria bacterium]
MSGGGRKTGDGRKTAALPAVLALLMTLLLVMAAAPGGARGQSDRQHIVYFQGTPDELEIYKIYGRHEGPTIMVLGGIQGDEPGAFLSADLYADMALKRGNLIVVPRANFKSIIQFDRGSAGDMNRKFAEVQEMDPDRERVEIIKNLMAESDVFLNLHDGSGFFRPVWESDMANPARYGQCIIADAEVFSDPASGRQINLGRDARRAVEIINRDIQEKQYKFSFANHDTLEETSRHKEQRKSATFYALTRLNIPAFGIETSKQLPSLEMKIHQHNLAVNAFMEIYGVVPEQPRIRLNQAVLQYLVISVNGLLPVAVADGQTLAVAPGDVIEVVHVGANYDRGLSVDVIGLGSLNDIRLPLVIDAPTSVIARRDNQTFGRIQLALLPPGSEGASPRLLPASSQAYVAGAGAGFLPDHGAVSDAGPAGQTETATAAAAVAVASAEAGAGVGAGEAAGPSSETGAESGAGSGAGTTAAGQAAPPRASVNGVSGFVLEVDGVRTILAVGGTLRVRKGARVGLVDIECPTPLPRDVVMNLRGFVGRAGDTTGNDKGTTADTSRDMIPRFAKAEGGGLVYQLGAERGPRLLAAAFLEIVGLKLKSVGLSAGGESKTLSLGQRWGLAPGTEVTVREVTLESGLPLDNPSFTLGGRPFPSNLPQRVVMPDIAVSLAVFSGGELAGKVVLFPK